MDTSNKKLLGTVVIAPRIIEEVKRDVKNITGFKNKIIEYTGQNTTNLLDIILFSAIILDASDIHLEPQEDDSRLRIRLDGVLQDVIFFEQNTYHSLISRLKLLSRLKLNITDNLKMADLRLKLEIL